MAITILPNHAPALAHLALTTPEDTVLALPALASDADGDALTYRIVTPPAHGALGGPAGALTYTPDPDFNGADAVVVVASDGVAETPPATVALTVTPVNDPPAVADLDLTVARGQTVSGTLVGSDADHDALVFAIASPPTQGTARITDPALGTFTYTAPADGDADTFTVFASDGQVVSRPATVRVAITGGGTAHGSAGGGRSCGAGSGIAAGVLGLLLLVLTGLRGRAGGRRGR